MGGNLAISSEQNKGRHFTNISQSTATELAVDSVIRKVSSIAFIGKISNNLKTCYEKYCQRLNAKSIFIKKFTANDLSKHHIVIIHDDEKLYNKLITKYQNCYLSTSFDNWKNSKAKNLICSPLVFDDLNNLLSNKRLPNQL